MAREILRWGTAAALLALAAISLRDAWAYGRTGRPDAMALRLPDRLRDRMHAIMRVRLNTRRLWLGSAALGFLVTLIEGVCTGQVYVPTLVVLSRHPALSRQAVGLLLLYNLMFVVPHAVVFLAAWRGLTNARLLAWSRGHVVWSKAGLGLLFLALAAILVLI